MKNGISKAFDKQLLTVNNIFQTSKTIQQVAISNLEAIQKYEKGLKDSSHPRTLDLCEQGLKLVGGIRDTSITKAEAQSWEKLIPLAIILIVTFTEEFLHEIFKNLIKHNLDKVNDIESKEIKFEWIKEKNFELSKSQSANLFIRAIYELGGGKTNFDNLVGINKAFDHYFGLTFKVESDIEKNFYYFSQLRHVLVHRGSKIDSKFMELMKKQSIPTPFKEGDLVNLTEADYKKCCEAFSKFFKIVEETVEKEKFNCDLSSD